MSAARRPAALLAAPMLLGLACVSDLDTFHAQAGVPVATYRATGVAFSDVRTFAVVGRLVPVGSGAPADVFYDAPEVLGTITAALEARGFQQVATIDPAAPPATPVAADLAVNVSALEPAVAEASDFWVASSTHLGPSAWGVAGGTWSYPWDWLPLRLQSGTLLVEIADLRGSSVPGQVGVLWASLAYGVSAQVGVYDTPAVRDAIDRAFAQSPYLSTGQGAP